MLNVDIYKVMAAKKKESNIIIRISPDVHDEFRAACAVKGATKSGLIHQFIFKTIREAKAEDAARFENELKDIKFSGDRAETDVSGATDEELVQRGLAFRTLEEAKRAALEAERQDNGKKAA